MALITFRNSKIVYYGPHTCENCGELIVKMGTEWGGTAFNNPVGPIYPNTEWYPHVCDPKLVLARKSFSASSRVTEDFPLANAVMLGHVGFVVLGERLRSDVEGGSYLVISANSTFAATEDGAWLSALERLQNGWPTWHIDLSKFGVHSRLTDDLQRLPECVSSTPATASFTVSV
jgi:hypothetical protein